MTPIPEDGRWVWVEGGGGLGGGEDDGGGARGEKEGCEWEYHLLEE